MKQKYDKLKTAAFLFRNAIKQAAISFYYSLIGNNERAYYHYKESEDAIYFLNIHLSYKSKKIN